MSGAELSVRVSSMRFPGSATALVEDFALDVPANAIVSLVGPSGIGKTTLLRIVAGLERRFDGTVKLGERAVTGATRDIQLVFQDYRLLPWKTVYENVRFAARTNGASADARAHDWLEFVGLQTKRDAWPKTLSGGEAGRAAFARAFVDQPSVLLLDEPFSSVDLVTRQSLQDALLRAWDRQRTTVVLVSHNVEDAVFLSDVVHVLDDVPLRIVHSHRIDVPRPRAREDERLTGASQDIRRVLLSASESSRMGAGNGSSAPHR